MRFGTSSRFLSLGDFAMSRRPFINIADPGYDDYPMEDDEPDEVFLEYEEMYCQIGYFIAQYSTVELAITAIIAILSNITNFDAFHTLTKGMDAKTKVERLKELAKFKNLIAKKGNLDVRLTHFADKTAGLRNKVAHAWILKSNGDPQKILFSNFAKMPFDLFQMEKKSRYKPDQILVEILHEHSVWLGEFMQDIMSLVSSAKKGAKLELKNPRSMEPTAFLLHLLQLETLAKDRMQPQNPIKT
jgi:hypothetical protein